LGVTAQQMVSYSMPDWSKQMPEMLLEYVEIFPGTTKVTGIISRQTSSFPEVFIFQ
jgi:hypothetical protein